MNLTAHPSSEAILPVSLVKAGKPVPDRKPASSSLAASDQVKTSGRRSRQDQAASPESNPVPGEEMTWNRGKMVTLLCLLSLAASPYGLYRLWKKDSGFARREQVLWSILLAVMLARFIFLLV